jgi:hypothetical protein
MLNGYSDYPLTYPLDVYVIREPPVPLNRSRNREFTVRRLQKGTAVHNKIRVRMNKLIK